MSAIVSQQQVRIGKPMLFHRMSTDCRVETEQREQAIKAVLSAPRAERGRRAAHAAARLGLKKKGLQNLCSAYAKLLETEPERAWTVAVDKRKYPEDARLLSDDAEGETSIPKAALKPLRIWLRGAPTVADVFRKLVFAWRGWQRSSRGLTEEQARAFRPKEMEGWEVCPPGDQYPQGCSLRSLERLSKKLIPKSERVMLRIGLRAAAGALAQVRSTRAELEVGEILEFDDMWHDVTVAHRWEMLRPVQFAALDVCSASMFHHGLKPRVSAEPLEDGKAPAFKHEYLTGADFRFFFADTLLNKAGHHPTRGTVIRLENGTASLPQDLRELIEEYTGGKIRFELSPMGQPPLVSGWWSGKRMGNPRAKSLIERTHELAHRYAWELPGQTGNSWLVRPEWLAGMEEEDARLVKFLRAQAERGLPATAEAYGLRRPCLDFQLHFVPMVAELYARMNGRQDHELEGWERFTRRVYRLTKGGEWFGDEHFATLNATEQATLKARLLAAPRDHMRMERLSPAQVWAAGRPRLVPIREELACLIVARDHDAGLIEGTKLERSAAHGACFAVTVEGEECLFEARVLTCEGAVLELPATQKYQVIPFGDRAFIRDLDGRYLGSAAFQGRIHPRDEEAKLAAFGHKAQRNADRMQGLREDHAEEAAAIGELREHNDAIFAGAGPAAPRPTRAERKAVNEEKAARRARLRQAAMGSGPEPEPGRQRKI